MQLDLLELDGDISPELNVAVTEIRGSLDRAANLTRQLLMFSRRQAMRVRTHDLNAIVEDILRMLRRVIGEGIDVTFEHGDVAVPFEGDAGMIEQVIVNLCVNARDAMPSGGRLLIATRSEEFGARSVHPGPWACLEVRDTGTGMSDDLMTHIFEPFFTTKEVGRGTGLGLATTHGIVTQHGGWIDVESEVGVGTRFRVYLPAAAGEVVVPATPAEPQRKARPGNATVLVVEDERVVRESVSRSLRQLGHTVIEAVTGRDALRVWAELGTTIDLVVTDMIMPDDINGIELVKRLRRDAPSLRAIIVSGYSLQLAEESLPEDIAFLAKPFSLASLTKAIEDSLSAA
jgi:CheY-like chemotaxis protein